MHTSAGTPSQILMLAMLRNMLFISSLKTSIASVWCGLADYLLNHLDDVCEIPHVIQEL